MVGEIMTDIEKSFGRQAFGLNPAAYHSARPDYPDWVYDMLVTRCGLRPGTKVFEIGAGTGTATRRLLALGADPLVAIEPDARLADFLEASLPDQPLKVLRAPFEEAALPEVAFDLGICAAAFHWLDEETALQKVARLLKPGGWWAAIWNIFGDASRPDPFHDATHELLSGFDSPSAGTRGIPFGLDAEARTEAIKRSGAFDIVDYKIVPWQLVLTADETVALYATYSNLTAREDREAVLAELGRIAREEFGGRVERNMTTSVFVGRRGVGF
ncbi:class I SAM-dependent methyltransferase [Pleomorphomonas oryzae]|uniref:class I SAM-dependent methyltransferase n=1 Tax=Pleomorphomonas oryzae TaxID=261934 RepID=UPI00040E8413|nr:class I SAM-dependent methyltransferase [Pleomorphomonas oryzae]